MKIFADANVLVSVLNKEYPSFSDCARILSLNDTKKFEIFTSPVCLAIAFYFSEKKSGNINARKKMEHLCANIRIAETGRNEVLKTVSNKKIHDFEDGLEYYSALHAGCKCIITEDDGDFYFSEIDVLKPKKFLENYF